TLRLSKNSPAVRQFTIHTWDDLIDERRAGMRAIIEMLAARKLHPRIHARLPLADAVRAHEMLESGAVLGKLLLHPAGRSKLTLKLGLVLALLRRSNIAEGLSLSVEER